MNKKTISNFVDCIDHEFAYDVTCKLAYDETLGGQWGFRTAGSIYEHRAADYLAQIMKEIGLSDVEKVPVKLDKWQFNSATLQLKGDEKVILPAAYAFSGTDVDGITAEIVDVGRGYAKDYEGKDVKGKIALAGIDLMEGWISYPYHEAYLNGAAALVTYTLGGYCGSSDDASNVHDAASEDYIPCVSISKNEGKYLAAQIAKGNNNATLVIDNEIEADGGIGYNVVGRIPGQNPEQQILFAGHYDKYYYGFQDDCSGVAVALAIAKAMVDSGYRPQNDIVFVSHAAEEWGATGSKYDWTLGAWKMITEAKPEWAGKTIALFNFELAAFNHMESYGQIVSVPEFGKFAKWFVEESEGYHILKLPLKDGFDGKYIPAMLTDDGLSYRFGGGVPYFGNVPAAAGKHNGLERQISIYHTFKDGKENYSRDVMVANIQLYGAMAMYIDHSPALSLDFCETSALLTENIDDAAFTACGADAAAYRKVFKQLSERGKAFNMQVDEFNRQYDNAIASCDNDAAEKYRKEGILINRQALKAFRFIQDHLVFISWVQGVVAGHEYHQANIDLLCKIIAACENENTHDEEGTGIFDLTVLLNGFSEGKCLLYSKEAIHMSDKLFFDALHPHPERMYWGAGKAMPIANTWDALKMVKANDFAGAKAEYERLLGEEYSKLSACAERQLKAAEKLTEMIPQIK